MTDKNKPNRALTVLFIMADQLRREYPSCYGRPHLRAPHIDALAARGVRFSNAYVQSPFCGPSRMSTYTGRYCRSHGATWNGFPLRIGERPNGDHLRAIGLRPDIVGKTHMAPDVEGMKWLGIDPESNTGVHLSECGFEPFERDGGLHPNSGYAAKPDHNAFLADHGDYLGEHWMGEKDLLHNAFVKVPLIVYDPRSESDVTRGQVRDELVKAIDLAPTFLPFFGGAAKPHILEGRRLAPLLHGADAPTDRREYAIFEYDDATREARLIPGTAHKKAQLFIIRDAHWKMIYAEGFWPMLFDLESDPDELVYLGAAPEQTGIRDSLTAGLFAWARQHHNCITVLPEKIEAMALAGEPPGIVIGH